MPAPPATGTRRTRQRRANMSKIKFGWAAWGHYNNAIAVVELFGWKGALVTAAGSAATFLFGAIKDYDPLAVWLATLVSAALIAGTFLCLSLWWQLQQPNLQKEDNSETSSSETTPLADKSTRELAGKVHAVLERALRFEFKLPLPIQDPFIENYETLKNSAHPIWVDPKLNQLRRDFINRVGLLGTKHTYRSSTQEFRELQIETKAIANGIITRLLGEATTSPTARVDRIPVLELFDLAKRSYGWEFENDKSLHQLDFIHGLRQAGSDQLVSFFGRGNRNHFERLTRGELLVSISPQHWRDYEFDIWRAFSTGDNFYMWSIKKRGTQNVKDGGFADIHADRTSAIGWLRNDADQYKGITKP